MRAAGYARVSTGKQMQEGQSYPEQVRRIEERCEQEGWTLVRVYGDKGISAADDRPDLEAMLAAAERREFDVLVVRDLDRVGRSLIALSKLVTALNAVDVRIISLVGRNVDVSTAEGRLQFNVLASVGEYEREKIAERVSGTARANAARGIHPGGPVPYGYRREPIPGSAKKRLVPVPHEAATVLRMYSECVAGRSQREIMLGLDADGIRTQQGSYWEQGTIGRVLRAHVYAGRVEVKGEVFPGLHPAIVPEDLWESAQALRLARNKAPNGARGRRSKGKHLFSGKLLRCGFCGGPMSPRTYDHREVYFCRSRHDRGTDFCSMPAAIPREAIDDAALRYFERVGLDLDATREAYAAHAGRRIAELAALRGQAEREEMRATDRLARVRADYMDGAIDAEDWKAMRAELTEHREAASAQLEHLRQQEADEASGGALRDAEQDVFRVLEGIRTAKDTGGLKAMRAALERAFAHFVLRPVWPEEAGHATEVGLNIADQWWLDPEVNPDMYAGMTTVTDADGLAAPWPLVQRQAVNLLQTKSRTG